MNHHRLYYYQSEPSLITPVAAVHDMLRFAQNVSECRKLLFAKSVDYVYSSDKPLMLAFFFFFSSYFSASSSLSFSSWTSSTAGALAACGHCDNCTRSPETVEHRDVTLEAWQILQVVHEVERQGGRVTLGMMTDLIRGAGGGYFSVGGGGRKGKGTAKEKVGLDLDSIAGGKVALNKDVSSLVHSLNPQFMVLL